MGPVAPAEAVAKATGEASKPRVDTFKQGTVDTPDTDEDREPSDSEVVQVIRQPLIDGITMVDLQRRIGHEHGKALTAKLNELADSVIELREARLRPQETHRRLRVAYSNNLGRLVAVFNRIPLQPNGKIVEDWERRILCSKSGVSPKEGDKEAGDKAADRPGEAAASSAKSPDGVPLGYKPLDENDPDDTAQYIELVGGVWVLR